MDRCFLYRFQIFHYIQCFRQIFILLAFREHNGCPAGFSCPFTAAIHDQAILPADKIPDVFYVHIISLNMGKYLNFYNNRYRQDRPYLPP